MRKCACSLAWCLAGILGIVFANPSNSQNEKIPLQALELTQGQAAALCNSVVNSQIHNKQLFQWVRVQKQHAEKSQQVQQQQQQQVEKKTGECFKIGFKSCLGQPRFPFGSDCGFYTLVWSSEKECSSSSVRSKRSISTGPVSLDHGQASHLCHTIQTPFPDSPEQINYVALKVQDPNSTQIEIPHAPQNCITWVYTPCMSENQQNCDVWHKNVKSTEECAGFQSNDPADYPKHPQTSSIDSALHHEISSSSLRETEQVIQCTSTNSNSEIQCEIVPVGAQTEISTEDRHSRQRRHFWCYQNCCCHHRGCDCCCSPDLYALLGPDCGLCCPIWTCNGQG